MFKAQIDYHVSKGEAARPYDSTYGVPDWFFLVSIGVIAWIIIGVWLSFKRQRKKK